MGLDERLFSQDKVMAITFFIKIAVKPRPSGRGCKAVTRKPPQGACLVSLMVTERSRSTESGLERLFAKKED